jgi:CBS domain containing-hemolysin-like protein
MLSELSQDIFTRIISKEENSFLQKVWSKYDEVSNALLFILLLISLWSLLTLSSFGFLEIFSECQYNILVDLGIILLVISIYTFVFFMGKRFCEKSIPTFASAIYIFTFILVPFIEKVNKVLIHISGKENDDVSMEEITDLVEEAREDGSIDAGKYRLMTNVMKFNEVLVSDVMTPRVVLFSCRADMTIEETAKLPELQIYSRFPIWNGDSIDDEVIGYVTTKEIFNAALDGKNNITLKELARQIHFIPENAELGTTLEEFLRNKQQLYLVVDEYGGIEGLITMEDVLETILGVEIIDEADKIADLRQLAKQKREKRIRTNYNNSNIENKV